MKILFLYNQGIGNCIQMIPLYLLLEEKYGRNIDVGYLMTCQGDSAENAGITPNPIIEPLTAQMVRPEGYSYIIRPPFIFTPDMMPIKEHVDSLREKESEVNRNLRISDYLGIERRILRKWREKEVRGLPERYICLHNGSNPNPEWDSKKYPKMEELAWMIQYKLGIEVISVGSPAEYIFGTTNYTGLRLTETANVIKNCTMYCGTDTGTYHMAGLMEKPGVAIFTMTSIGKNHDREFHHTIDCIQRDDLECCPCQWYYHWSPDRITCRDYKCQNIPVEAVFELIKGKISE